jgi:hypothetical protein
VALPAGEWQAIGTDLGAVAIVGGKTSLGPWGIALARKTA